MDKNTELDRLLRAAAKSSDDTPEMPFGFETRVIAQWRALPSRVGWDTREFGLIFRRIAATAIVVTAFASAAAYWQIQQNSELNEPLDNAYAIADTAIDAGVSP